MKRFIVKKEQLIEYIETKKAETTFYEILNQLHLTTKMLNENVSNIKASQSIIENYKRKELITPKVYEMLIANEIINENYEIL